MVARMRPGGMGLPPADPAAAGFFVACVTICRLSPHHHVPFFLPDRLRVALARCPVWAACACVVWVQGCALEQRAEPVPAALTIPQVLAAPPPIAIPPAPKVAALPRVQARAWAWVQAQLEAQPDPKIEADALPLEQGAASWYGAALHRRRTASGERFDMHALTAAHRTLPFGTLVCVRSLVNNKVVQVRINDRGPHAANRIIDLSHAAAQSLGMLGLGIKSVALTVLEPEEEGCAAPS